VLAHANDIQAAKKAQALKQTLTKAPAEWNGARIPVSFSYGASEILTGDSVETALARADEAMYAQKRAALSPKL
jgi:GGDEF domain-containing protein